jgi:predicted ribosome quality control (RQC) complex YloA/Tae2 family protein
LVGRGAAHNDQLTLHVARPRDLWLHAREWSGAHVVVPLGRGESCPPEVLVDAAHLAAHFSDFSGAREEAVVEITYGLRKHVRKPRGSAPGAVVLDREKVLVLRRQDTVTERLLAAEVEP